MQRKDVLLFMLEEARNELANALEELTKEHLAQVAVAGQNPIGWIVCHLIGNVQRFLAEPLTEQPLLPGNPRLAEYTRYTAAPPSPANPPPDLSSAIADLDDAYRAGIALIGALSENALDQPGPRWNRPRRETVAENCVRVINHANAHIREIWLLRWALGARATWPHQTLFRRSDEEGGAFYVPARADVLRMRSGS